MHSVLYVMAIMGCADGSDQCAEARVESAGYASIQACQAAMPGALRRNADLSFPVIAATCRRSAKTFVSNDAPRRPFSGR